MRAIQVMIAILAASYVVDLSDASAGASKVTFGPAGLRGDFGEDDTKNSTLSGGPRCRAKNAVWIQDSSMVLDGKEWDGEVHDGNYHCMLSRNSGIGFDYRVDCTKYGGDPTDFYFHDGNDKYELLMRTNGNHHVKYNGKGTILAIGYCP